MMILYRNLIEALGAALKVGFCHTDLRPDNVVVVGETFVVIDWGLATPPDTQFHEHRAGIDFYHDEIVITEVEDAPLFKPEFDKFSAKCIAYFFAKISIPWTKFWDEDDGGTSFIDERSKCLSMY